MRIVMRALFATAALVSGLAAGTAGAQVIRGQVQDFDSKQPVPGAAVVIRDSTHRNIGFARTDAMGNFYLRVSDSTYSLHVMRVGFSPESLSTTSFGADTTNVVLEMRPIAVHLTPAVIEAEKRGIRDVMVMGINLRAVDAYIITPSEVAVRARGARTYLDVVRTALPAGVMVNENSSCVASNRASSGSGAVCAMVYVDGVRIDDPTSIIDLAQPGWLDHAVWLNATIAGVRFGTGASGGVLLLFTKYGGYSFGRH